MDIWWDTNGDQVLGIICKATAFMVAEFVTKHTSQALSDTFVLAWEIFGFPESILTDAERGFGSAEWIEFCRANNIVLRGAAGGAHHQVGLIERHNAFLKGIFELLKKEYPKENKRVILKMSLMAKNSLDTYRGMPASMRVFGQMIRVPDIMNVGFPQYSQPMDSYEQGSASRHMFLLHRARELYMRLQTSEKLRRAQSRQTRSTPGETFSVGQLVYWYADVVKKSARG